MVGYMRRRCYVIAQSSIGAGFSGGDTGGGLYDRKYT